MKKIGGITFHASHNYGSCLQAYALQEYINDNFQDYEYKIINFRTKKQKEIYCKPLRTKSIFGFLVKLFYLKSLDLKYKKFEDFINKKLQITEEFENESEFVNKYDVLLAAGDQIWNPRCWDFSWLYFFKDVKSDCKISYAPSMGPCGGSLTNDEKIIIKESLQDFKIIGVRENGTKRIIDDLLLSSKEVKVLPDPVLLLSKKKWASLIEETKINIRKPYILFYTLNASYETYKTVKKIGKLLKLPVYITKPVRKCDYLHFFSNYFSVGPLEFLKMISDAALVLTTSFHACVFSAIFNKKFFAIDVNNDNRIRGFLEEYKLENCFITSNDNYLEKINNYTIDYSSFENKLNVHKKDVYEFFNQVL